MIGHALDLGRSLLGEGEASVVTLGPWDEDIARWCRWSGVHYRASGENALATFQAEAQANGWSQVLLLSAHAIFVPRDTLLEALALLRYTQAEVVIVGPNDGDYPLGPAAVGMQVRVLRDLTVPDSSDIADLVAAISHQAFEIPLPSAFDPKVLPLDLATPGGFAVAERILGQLGRMPFQATTAALLAASRPAVSSPWHGAAGPLLIAEIGGNHEGDFDAARRMTELAIRSGADGIKFQLYRGATLVSPVESPDRYRHFQRFELSRAQHIHLAEMCREAGRVYVASVWDAEMLDWIDPYLEFYKVGSGDLTAWPLLDELARRGKPILLSTGLATLDEVVQTVDRIRRINPAYQHPAMLCVMQCTSMYPIPDADAHLRVMDTFREQLNVAVGYSDHTIGEYALQVAAAMGAEVLEFHFTDQREGRTFRDHKVSLIAEEVRRLRDTIARIMELRGSHIKSPQSSELTENHHISFRRGVYAQHDIPPGRVLTADDLVCLRPAHGTDARDCERLMGARSLTSINAFAAIFEGQDYDAN